MFRASGGALDAAAAAIPIAPAAIADAPDPAPAKVASDATNTAHPAAKTAPRGELSNLPGSAGPTTAVNGEAVSGGASGVAVEAAAARAALDLSQESRMVR